MKLDMIDWQEKIFNMIPIVMLALWCILILNKTLGTKDKAKEKIKKGSIATSIVVACTFMASIGMDMLDRFTQTLEWSDHSLSNMALSWMYVLYNTLYILTPTMLSYIAGRWLFHQDRTIKTFTAVLTGLITIVLNEFVYRVLLLPFYQIDEESMMKVIPSKGLEFLVLGVCLLFMYMLYQKYVCEKIKQIIQTPDGRMDRFVKIPVYSNIIFAILIAILQTFGISMAAMNWIDAMIYFMVSCCLAIVYLMMYWSIFTGIDLSTRRMRDQAELSVASKIQSSLLPSVFPPFPQHHEFSIFASMTPAKEVGGDFYDFFLIDEDHLAIAIADVSGKGIPAALFMMTTRTLLKSLAMNAAPIEEVFYKANNSLCENNEAEMFVTAWMGILDLRSGLLKFVNAGHNPPLIRKEKAYAFMDHRKYHRSLMLGARENITYRVNEMHLQQGDALYLYTDGVSEANDPSGALYGEERLLRCLQKARDKDDPKEILKAVDEDVTDHVHGADPFDDITMLGLCIHTLKDTLYSKVEDEPMSKVNAFVEKRLLAYGCEKKLLHQALLSTDEICSNILKYSNAKEVMVHCSTNEEEISISFADDGVAYNPIDANEPDIYADLSQRKMGGLGIHVVKNIMDSMSYAYQNGNNVLTIQKKKDSK